ncbi:hypothetical protein [Mesorhizobium sp. A556]
MEDHEITLKLKWRQTWEEKSDDFVCEASTYSGSVGRIYLHESGPMEGQWLWSFQAFGSDISRNIGALSGYETSARRAAKEVEDAWFSAIRGTLHEQESKPSANAYAAAKGM